MIFLKEEIRENNLLYDGYAIDFDGWTCGNLNTFLTVNVYFVEK